MLNTLFIVIACGGKEVTIRLENLDASFIDRLTPNSANAAKAPHYYIRG